MVERNIWIFWQKEKKKGDEEQILYVSYWYTSYCVHGICSKEKQSYLSPTLSLMTLSVTNSITNSSWDISDII